MSLFDSASLIVTPNGVKAGKLYSVKPTDGSGDLSVVRATTATRVNSEGLIEVVPKNLLTYSEQFENSAWTKNNTNVTANSIISPDGTQNADKITPNNTNTQHFVLQNLSATSGVSYTYSVFAKKGEIDILQLSPSYSYLTTQGYANFNLTSGIVTASGGGVTASIINFGNNWYKCILTFTANATGTGGFALFMQNSPTATRGASYLGDGTSGLHLWGSQVEAGSNATSYIPTVSSAVTRNADVISKTGISDLIGQTEGTMFVDVNFDYISDTFSNLISVNNNVNTQAISLNRESNNRLQFFIFNGGVQANIITTNNTSGIFKVVATYKANEFKLYVNGVLIGTDTSGTLPTLITFNLGNIVGGVIQKNNINSAVLWKTALTEQECINLTTI